MSFFENMKGKGISWENGGRVFYTINSASSYLFVEGPDLIAKKESEQEESIEQQLAEFLKKQEAGKKVVGMSLAQEELFPIPGLEARFRVVQKKPLDSSENILREERYYSSIEAYDQKRSPLYIVTYLKDPNDDSVINVETITYKYRGADTAFQEYSWDEDANDTPQVLLAVELHSRRFKKKELPAFFENILMGKDVAEKADQSAKEWAKFATAENEDDINLIMTLFDESVYSQEEIIGEVTDVIDITKYENEKAEVGNPKTKEMTVYEYDENDRLLSIETRADVEYAIFISRTEYEYDDNGNLIRKTDYGKGFDTRYVKISLQTAQTDDKRGVYFVDYPNSNNKKWHLGKTEWTEYEYDDQGIKTAETRTIVTFMDGEIKREEYLNTFRTEFEYDEDGRPVKEKKFEKTSKKGEPDEDFFFTGEVSYEYNAFGQVISKSEEAVPDVADFQDYTDENGTIFLPVEGTAVDVSREETQYDNTGMPVITSYYEGTYEAKLKEEGDSVEIQKEGVHLKLKTSETKRYDKIRGVIIAKEDFFYQKDGSVIIVECNGKDFKISKLTSSLTSSQDRLEKAKEVDRQLPVTSFSKSSPSKPSLVSPNQEVRKQSEISLG